ncbi:MAG: hypothetical protein GX556_06475 [Fibrobacter sp.]|nr:hypothetical protein [Fibrobacter sp.]
MNNTTVSSLKIADMMRRDSNIGPASIVQYSAISEAMNSAKCQGVKKGLTTGWPLIDEYMNLITGLLYIVTGIPSHGKSSFMKSFIVHSAKIHNWRWALYCPEDYPLSFYVQALSEIITGKPLHGKDGMSEAEREQAVRFINDHFVIFEASEEAYDIETILLTVERLQQVNPVQGILIDPFNELESTRPSGLSETDWIGATLARCRRFARKNDVAFFIVAHPTKLRKLDNGTLPVPGLYDISGSQHWANKADIGITVQRDFDEGCTYIHVLKVRFRYYGYPGVVKLYYKPMTGRYLEYPKL